MCAGSCIAPFATCRSPLGDRRKGERLYQYVNKHRCDCGNKKELKVANESSYWIWDLESFTGPVFWRDGNEIDKPTSVSEHKVIFVAACNMADPTDNISFYGEDCLDELLKLILQDKKFKGTAFLAHNAGGYDCQFVMRWIERHGHKLKTIPSPTSLYRPLHLEHDGVRFIDSWNFTTIPLSKFGKCFDLPQSKTDFPMDSAPGTISSIVAPCL
jgi:hypothetical protein